MQKRLEMTNEQSDLAPTADAAVYVVPATLRLRATPYGSLQVDSDLAEPVGEIAGELVGMFLLFARPRTIASAHAGALSEWTIEQGEFRRLVEGWASAGLLTTAATKVERPARMTLFQKAFAEHARSGAEGFSLKSLLPSQRPQLYYPGLASREVHAPSAFPWVARLEAAFPAIRSELAGLLADDALVAVNRGYTTSGEWAAGHLWIFGQKNEAICRRCPVTTEVVGAVQGALGTAMFSALAPRTFIAPHCGFTSAKLRCQLPLMVPPGCRLKVGDSELDQREGRAIVFDDSFLHSAWNDSDSVRYVLLFDFFHPDLDAGEVEYLSTISEQKQFAKPYVDEAKAAPRVQWTRESLAER
jgi:hypothetical protein